MPVVKRGRLPLACAACFLLGWVAGNREPARLPADEAPPPKKEVAPAFPMASRVGGNVYLQNAAEYRACCLGIYRAAAGRLESILAAKPARLAKPAVVLDLDETVLDNSAFQTFLYRTNQEYTPALWADFEENYPGDVTLIPGARRFVERAEALGVTVVYISNRTERYRKSTEAALERLGLKGAGFEGRLFLRPKLGPDKDGPADKTARRAEAAEKYNVLMLFGDNLRDFSESFAAPKLDKDLAPEEFQKAIRARAALVDDTACHWGVDWFVLPNPVYGEWENLIPRDPTAVFHPTGMRAKGR